MNDSTPFDTIGDEPIEARIVSWVLGEASAFEAAELERLCEERPELQVFRRRMRALHGLLTEAESAEPDNSWKLPEEKRKVLDEIFGDEKIVSLESDKDARIRRSGRRALLAIAACVMLTLFLGAMFSSGSASIQKARKVKAAAQRSAAKEMAEEKVDFLPGGGSGGGGGGYGAGAGRGLEPQASAAFDELADDGRSDEVVTRSKGIKEESGRLEEAGKRGVDIVAGTGFRLGQPAPASSKAAATPAAAAPAPLPEMAMGGARERVVPPERQRNLSANKEMAAYGSMAKTKASKPSAAPAAAAAPPVVQSTPVAGSGRATVSRPGQPTAEEFGDRSALAGQDAQSMHGANRFSGGSASSSALSDSKFAPIDESAPVELNGAVPAAQDLDRITFDEHMALAAKPQSMAGAKSDLADVDFYTEYVPPSNSPADPSQFAANGVTNGLRSGDQAINRNNIDAILNNPNRTKGKDDSSVAAAREPAPAEFAMELGLDGLKKSEAGAGGGSGGGSGGFGLADRSESKNSPPASGKPGEAAKAQNAFATSAPAEMAPTGGEEGRYKIDGPAPAISAGRMFLRNGGTVQGGPAEELNNQKDLGDVSDGDVPLPAIAADKVNAPDSSMALGTGRADEGKKENTRDRAGQLDGVEKSWESNAPADGKKPEFEGFVNNGAPIADQESQKRGRGVDENADLYWDTSKKEKSGGTEYEIHTNYSSEYLFKGIDLKGEKDAEVLLEAAQKAAVITPLESIEEIAASEEAYSTFSLNISDASFQIAKAALEKGERPDPTGIKVEQFYNAVDYGDPAPASNEPVAATIEQAAHPIIPGRNLVRVSLKTAATGRGAAQPLRLTLLVDQSGSMVREDRRTAMTNALKQLGGLLTPNDHITVVGFSRESHLLADNWTGDKAGQLGDLINQTASEGGTNLEQAINLGEQMAARPHAAGEQNRIVLFTDGAANLGNANPERLAERVKSLRQKGIAFDIAGIGADGVNDRLLSELARNGNGRYYVVGDSKNESFARQLAGAFR
ncbi:MAG: von Willebrand factor type A domain-containing protein, partial [Luteolibacter sp.]